MVSVIARFIMMKFWFSWLLRRTSTATPNIWDSADNTKREIIMLSAIFKFLGDISVSFVSQEEFITSNVAHFIKYINVKKCFVLFYSSNLVLRCYDLNWSNFSRLSFVIVQRYNNVSSFWKHLQCHFSDSQWIEFFRDLYKK